MGWSIQALDILNLVMLYLIFGTDHFGNALRCCTVLKASLSISWCVKVNCYKTNKLLGTNVACYVWCARTVFAQSSNVCISFNNPSISKHWALTTSMCFLSCLCCKHWPNKAGSNKFSYLRSTGSSVFLRTLWHIVECNLSNTLHKGDALLRRIVNVIVYNISS